MPYMRVGKCVYKKNANGQKGKKKLYSVEEVVREEIKNILKER